MKKKLLGILLGSSLLMAACGNAADDSSEASNPQEAADEAVTSDIDPEKIVSQKCSSCHGGDLSGGMGPALKNIGSTLSYEEILSTIQNGKGQMPKGVIDGEEAEVVAEWLSNKK